MKNNFPIIFFTLLTSVCFGQTSDLENSTHDFTYNGDSLKLKRLVGILREQGEHIIPDEGEICEIFIKDIESSGKNDLQIIYINLSIGVSCRGVSLTVFFRSDHYLGCYNSDIVVPKKLIGQNLIWEFENGEKIAMDLSKGFPQEFYIGDRRIEFIK